MKKLILACGAFVAFGLASCSPSKEDVKKEFIKACNEGGDKQMTTDAAKKVFHDYCECSGEKVADKFSIKELEEFNKLQKTPDPARQQELQTKMMTVIQPCLTELQSKMMNAMGGQAPAAGM